jgi:hypothetical protein
MVKPPGRSSWNTRAGQLDEPQRQTNWCHPREADARAWVERCIATGGDGWSEISEGPGPGGAGWHLGTTR